ncbi:hypothetical protein [Carnobacterium maltaromaticum]|uniref:hypothetical protein n=1 Tax=Carnobacterium maltaromaticum TaxID=2751 RepID=UPI000704C629|nr:hypothetical protein [Carnobacterium maltaromaticum]AOA04047.1 hypothetical protein BFC23_17005 [Carnobacterium maltaromaticum]MBC9810400.1 hypothetical protein [Carnobacterium maltaromaticum]GED49944.1 hypothetical protein CMA01_23540 [Carnobacterium maltaromaticum]
MRIEEFWDDKTEFDISFLTEDNRIIEKKIAVEFGTTELQVRKIVHKSFDKVKKVIDVEEVNDILSYKKITSMV